MKRCGGNSSIMIGECGKNLTSSYMNSFFKSFNLFLYCCM
jgi:hypothetical protein